jgi:hypothetical protein
MLIYVAGPYNADTIQEKIDNTNRAIDAGLEIFAKGHTPYIPHLLHYADIRARDRGIVLGYEDYMQWGLDILEKCDAILLLDNSPGADRELMRADELIKERFFSVEDIPHAGTTR